MSIRLSVVITLAALVSYYHIFAILNDQVRDSLQKYISERGEKESATFLSAEANHRKFKDEFLKQWPTKKTADTPTGFHQFFVPQKDGGRRIHPQAFQGFIRQDGSRSQHITGYIGKDAPQKKSFFNKLQLSYELIDRYGAPWTLAYANLYVSMPENVNLVYWPGIPWGDQAKSDLNVNTEEWVYVANMENNPNRQPAWTGLYYDQTADEWMVSLATPVDEGGIHQINIGHDILLNTLFERVFNDKLKGTYNFIFRQDRRIIAHPDLVDQLQDQKGVLHAQDAGDPGVLKIIDLIISEQKSINQKSFILDDKNSGALLAVTRIDGPDWYFVTFYPESLLSSAAWGTAYIVSIVGIVSLIVELLILFHVLKGQVLEPISIFRRFSKAMERGGIESIDILRHSPAYKRDDEVGELAQSMVEMATTIQSHEHQLIEQVARKTQELSETNEVLQKESISRKEVLALLQTIAKDVSCLQGTNYFSTLGEFLAESLDADFVIICRLSDDGQNLHSLAAHLDKKPIKNIVYPIAGTPCEIVIKKGPQLYNSNIQSLFPEDKDLVDLNLDSYIGTPMYDTNGRAIGHLAVMKRSAFTASDKARMIMDSVSARAASELIRHVNEEIIIRQASTDTLTGLANRSLFLDRLSQSILSASRHNNKLAILFVDFDHFKLINDQMGHTEGDKLLQIFALRLSRCVREEDTVARFGGDEFILLLNNINDIKAPEIVTRSIQSAIREEVHLAGTSLTLSCSIGVAIYPDDGSTSDVLINHADTAMYRAKELGRNNVQFFTSAMNAAIEERRKIEHDLRQALSKGEFVIFYQPIISLKNNDVTKLEALLRWDHPNKRQISPDTFIPIAEQTGHIVALGDYVLMEACRNFSLLKQRYPSLRSIGVNCSPRQFQDSEFPTRIFNMIDEQGLSNDCIDLEITESLFIDKEDNISLQTLKNLQKKGIAISLDDFGTGYSSLAYLKQLPINTLKIDRSFIADITDDTESLALVRSIIDLAHNFKLDVVAEGVETKDQSEILIENGCDYVQGYYYCRPQPLCEHIGKSNAVIQK